MTWHLMARDGINLRGRDIAEGPSLVFQHGLGGDDAQVAEVVPQQGLRRLTLECRGHGQSGAGPFEKFSIPQFAQDVLDFADQRGIESFTVGGISMGAAIALRLAVIAPERVNALVLARPAWHWDSAPDNMKVFGEIIGYLENNDREGFENSDVARHFALHAPDNLASFLKLFDRADVTTTVALLSGIARSGPDVSKAEIQTIAVPTLILANELDLVHPLSIAQILADTIAQSTFKIIAPKALDRERHLQEFRRALQGFIDEEGIKP